MVQVSPVPMGRETAKKADVENQIKNRRRKSIKYLARRMTVNADAEDVGLDLMARQKEKAKVLSAQKENFFEFISDAIDITVKTVVVATYTGTFTLSLNLQYAIAVLLSISFSVVRIYWIMDMHHVAEKGFSKSWKQKKRIRTAIGEEDPRIARDAAVRRFNHARNRSIQAFIADMPWIVFNVYRIQTEESEESMALATVISVVFAGYGFGLKFASFINFLKALLMSEQKLNRSDVYESLPADVKCGVGCSAKKDSIEAITETYESVKGKLGCEPTFCIVTMTANHDHAPALKKLRELAPNVVFTGGTTCQGVMAQSQSFRTDMCVVAIWALYDPEGHYQVGMFDYGDGSAIEDEAAHACTDVRKKSKDALFRKSIKTTPSFVWIMPGPGPEDRVLRGVSSYFGDVPLFGGSSADNDITGKWVQWSSQEGEATIGTNGCSFCICYCSAIVQSQLFTGYNATGKKGIVTKTDGLRHILEIDGRPAAEVYNEWTGGEYTQLLREKEDSNVLGPSSLFPLGQKCGVDQDGEVFYRSMHPHMFVKKTMSVTLFSDVSEGEEIVMMTGTRDNIVNRIAGVASYVMRNGGFSLQEIRGTLVIFCAGCMMFADEAMDQACEKISRAIGNTPYLGIHTFGEQGQFPDGKNRHGNLMFSALVVSSRRRVMKLLNVDTGKMVLETDAEFSKIVASGRLKLK